MAQVRERPVVKRTSVTIANGAALSTWADTEGLALVGIEMPSGWTAASITFQAAGQAGAADIYDNSTERSSAAAASRYIAVDPNTFAGIPKLRVRSGTTGTPVNQLAARTLVLVFRSW